MGGENRWMHRKAGGGTVVMQIGNGIDKLGCIVLFGDGGFV